MKNFTCPHCNEKFITVWKKLELSPRDKKRCPNCGQYIGLSYKIPVVFFILISIYFIFATEWINSNTELHFLVLICWLVTSIILTLIFSPIIKK